MRLYDLAEQYNDLQDVLEGSENPEAVQAMLDGLEGAFDEKVESIVKLMRSKAAERDAISEEAQRLHDRAARINKEYEWLEGYVYRQMLLTGKEKVKSSLFDISIGLCPPAVQVTDETDIPEIFFIMKPAVRQLDKRTLLEKLKSGEEIPGAEIVQRKTLRIK